MSVIHAVALVALARVAAEHHDAAWVAAVWAYIVDRTHRNAISAKIERRRRARRRASVHYQ